MAADTAFIRDLCNLEIPSAIKFSPDGQKILYSTELTWGHCKGKYPVSTLWLASPGQPNSSRKLTSGLFKDYAPAWSPNGESVAFISDRAKAGERWAIYVMPSKEGGAAYPITPIENERPIQAYAFSPDGTSIAFLSPDEKTVEQRTRERNGEDVHIWGEQWAYARLRVVDLQKKHIRSLYLDRHVTNLCWSPDRKQIGIVTCSTPDIEEPFLTGSIVSTVDSQLVTVRDLCHFPKHLWDLTWAENGKLYFCGPTPADKMFCGQCVYTIDAGLKCPTYEKLAFGVVDDVVSLTKASKVVVAKVEHRLESRICLLDGKVLYGKKEELEAFDVTFTADGDEIVLALATSNVNNPVEVFTRTASGGAMVQLSNHGSVFKDHNFGTCSFLSCRSTDGEVELDSIYLSPASHTLKADGAKPLPTAVMIHGGPNTRLTNAFNTYYYMLTPYLLSLGYGILLPNYRGSRGRGEKFASYSIGGIGKYDYADIIAMTQNAIEQGYADKDRLFVGGWSQGGLLSYLCSVRNGSHGNGWKFKASSPGAGICDSDAMGLTSDLGSSFQAELNNDRVAWNMDKDDTRNRSASALWEFNAAVKRSKQTGTMVVPPMLILHGENDARCPVTQAWGMRRALHSQGLPFEFVSYPRQEHFFKEQKFWIDMAIRIGRWCDRYIGSKT